MAENSGIEVHKQSLSGLSGLFNAVLSDDLQDQHLTHQVLPSRSHIIWNVGHIAWAFDRVVRPALGLDPVMPESYVEMFAMGSQPVADRAKYPALDELRQAVGTAVDSFLSRLDSLTDSDLAKPLPDSSPIRELFPTLGAFLGATVFHTGYHAGQIALLRRVQGLPSGLGM